MVDVGSVRAKHPVDTPPPLLIAFQADHAPGLVGHQGNRVVVHHQMRDQPRHVGQVAHDERIPVPALALPVQCTRILVGIEQAAHLRLHARGHGFRQQPGGLLRAQLAAVDHPHHPDAGLSKKGGHACGIFPPRLAQRAIGILFLRESLCVLYQIEFHAHSPLVGYVSILVPNLINPATKYVALSASNRARIKARLAGNGKPLSKAATPIRTLFEAPNKLIIKK